MWLNAAPIISAMCRTQCFTVGEALRGLGLCVALSLLILWLVAWLDNHGIERHPSPSRER